jgi:hypothetical protein
MLGWGCSLLAGPFAVIPRLPSQRIPGLRPGDDGGQHLPAGKPAQHPGCVGRLYFSERAFAATTSWAGFILLRFGRVEKRLIAWCCGPPHFLAAAWCLFAEHQVKQRRASPSFQLVRAMRYFVP